MKGSVTPDADTLAAPSDDALGRFDAARPKLADRYELLGLLGVGGMGAVYRVRDTELGEIVALKMLRPEWVKNPAALERFRQEVRLARRVTHKNVARTFDIGEHQKEKFLTMECVDGGSLASRIEETGALGVEDAVEIGRAICAGLAAAHQAGVVHRDLKPENVLIAKDGRVVVTDFGIAIAGGADESALIGTPAYMAPEQLVPHGPVDHRADVYALGAILYEMLTGARAWPGDAPMLLLANRARTTSPPDPRAARDGLSDSLAKVVMRCMDVSPAARFATADDVARALSESLTQARPSVAPARNDMPLPAHGKTVAVLPFENAGPESDAYVADGLTSDLIDTLSMTRGLLVRPRAVVAKIERAGRGVAELGRELGAQVLVEGSVRRAGDKLRIGVRVIGAADELQLWAKRFDAPLSDLFVVTDAAAQEIAHALTTEISSFGSAASDPAAIELFLRAKQQFWDAWGGNVGPATEQLERALALAPNDARILAATANARARMLFLGDGDRAVVLARAKELSERAVVVAPELGETWAALASLRINSQDAVAAAEAIREGLAHAPNSAMLQDAVGRLLTEIDQLDEAEVRLKIALDLDPSLVSAQADLARLYALRGEWKESDRIGEGMTPSVPLAAHKSRFALWRRRDSGGTVYPPDTYARVYDEVARSGTVTEAQREFMNRRSAAATGRIRTLFHQRAAELYAFVGDADAAFDSMSRSIEGDLIDLAWMRRCPLLSELRSDPRWAPLQERVTERARRICAALGIAPSTGS